uniref:NACHT domain-containing protein n=1 Tax=Mola mola TaxID=94237 RepID=A0A3Q3WTG2_MOLML
LEPALCPVLSYWSMTSEENSNSMDAEDGCLTRYKPDKTLNPIHYSKQSSAICDTLGKLSNDNLKTFKMTLWRRYPKSLNTNPQNMDLLEFVDELVTNYGLEKSLQLTKILLEEKGLKKAVDYLETLCIRNEVRHDLCECLRRKYGDVFEDSAIQEERLPFDDVFTNLHITSTCDNGPNIDHEVMTIEKLDSNQETGKMLSTKDIFSAKRLEQSYLRLLLVIGVAGSGKSMAVRKLILDWIEKRSHEHVSFLFPMPFKELKKFEGSEISFLEIIQTLYPATKKLRDKDYRSEDCKMMFIFDGLDEYTEQLDFHNTKPVCDHTDPATLNVLVVNLLRDRLLYRGLFVVTSRPQVNCYVPWDTSYDAIDLLGFCDPQKDEYFKKRFNDPDQAARVIAHIHSVKTLHIMCHLPLFCSLLANEYERIFQELGTQAELPKCITCMYTRLLLALLRQHRRFRAQDRRPHEERDFLMKLGKLAFKMLALGQFKVTRDDWKKTGDLRIDDVEAVINSGLCTQYITKPFFFHQEKVLSFIHPTVQEYLAALYAFFSFRHQGKNIFEKQAKQRLIGIIKGHKAMELYNSAVYKSLLCEDGKLDIFLRFLFGMATKSNLKLLEPLYISSVKWPTFTEDAAALIRKKIQENQYPGRICNLQRCLEELGVYASEGASC